MPTINKMINIFFNCIKSTKDKAYQNIKVIIVDNYSTVITKRICIKFKI